MKLPVLTKSRVGFSIVLVGVMTLVGVESCRHVAFFQARIAIACGAFGLIGLLLLIMGPVDNLQGYPLTFLKSFRYWGFILATSAILVYFITPRIKAELPRPAPVPKPVKPLVLTNAPPPPPETNAPPDVVFPPLKLSGVVYSGVDSTAVINGRTLRVGGYVGEVKLVAIEQRAVIVELSGARKVVTLEK